jgi:class 3 adenylate cyclase
VPTRDEYEAAGLLAGVFTTIDDRIALLDWLASEGFTIEEMVGAHARRQLNALATDRVLIDGPTYTFEEASERSGIPIDVLRSVLRASGFQPDRAVLSEASLALFAEFGNARLLFSDDEVLHFTRVMGSSLARIAEAANSLFLVDVESPLMVSTAASELELAKKAQVAMAALDSVASAIGALFRLHMIEATDRSREARAHATEPDLVPLAVGFVDLVGFTPLTATSTARELIALVLDFESRAYDIVTEHGGRLVKLIGDEVMFTAIDPVAACEIVLEMFAALDHDSAVTPRAGIAYGNLLAHGGDCYGTVVNLASRVADVAVPWEILVTDTVAERLPDHIPVDPAGRRMLKGFEAPIPLNSLVRALSIDPGK